MKNIKAVWQMIKILKQDHPAIIYVFVFGILSEAVFPYYGLYFSSQILNALTENNMAQAKWLVIVLLVGSLLIGSVRYICNQVLTLYYFTVNDSYHMKLTEKSLNIEFEKYEKAETLEMMQKIRNNKRGMNQPSDQLRDLYILGAYTMVSLFAFIYLIYLLAATTTQVSWLVCLAFLVFIAAFAMFSHFVNQRGNQTVIQIKKESIDYNAHADYFINLCLDTQKGKDIRLFGIKPLLQSYNDEIDQRFKGSSAKTGRSLGHIKGINALLLQVFTGLSFFFVGYSILNNAIKIGDILLYTGAMTQLSASLSQISSIYRDISFGMVTLSLYHDYINTPDMDYDGTLPIEKRDDKQYHLVFEDVSFRYPGTDQNVLDHINLDLNIGKSYALVGQNGAGKSTLIKLLCRLYEPTEGRILLNGIDIKKYDFKEYTEIFSVVFQDFKLYALDLDENIACSSKPDEEKVKEVLKQAGIYDHVMEHPEGIHQRLYKETGDGVMVSGGEAQKIAIARALYKDAAVVILDEPTSALDPISEAEIYEHFHTLIKDKTAIYISHRMSSCQFCDEIIVLDEGNIKERGSHGDLIEKDGIYAKLWQAQAQYYQ